MSSKRVSLNLSGVYPPITTTFNEQGNILYDKLQHNLEKWKLVPLKGMLIEF